MENTEIPLPAVMPVVITPVETFIHDYIDKRIVRTMLSFVIV